MAVTFACEKCHAEYTVADSLAGKKGRCNACGHLMQVPGGTANRAAAAAPAKAPAPAPAPAMARNNRAAPPAPPGSTAGDREIGFADPFADESRDMPVRGPRTPVAAARTPSGDSDDPLAALASISDDGTIPFSEDFEGRRTFSLNIGGAASSLCLILGVVFCLLPLLNQPVINAYGRLPVYTGLALGLLGAFLLVQKGRGTAGVVAGVVVVASFFGGVIYKPAAPSTDNKPVVQKTTPSRGNQGSNAAAAPRSTNTTPQLSPAVRAHLASLNSFDAATRLAAAQELLKSPPKDRLGDVVTAMEPKLTDEDPRLRLLAVQGVMLQPADHTASVIAHLVQDRDQAVREAALRALGKLGGEAAINAIASRLADDAAVAREAFAAASKDAHPQFAIDAFTKLLADGRDTRLRAIAIDELAARNAPNLTQTLVSLLGDADPRVRDAAIRGLGQLKATSAIRAIAGKLGESEEAVATLQSFGSAAEQEAIAHTSSYDKLVRAAAARVLITAATPQSLPKVKMLANDEDPAVASAAVEAWKRLVPEDFTPIQDALRDLASRDMSRQRDALDKLATELKPDENRAAVAMQLVAVALGDQPDLRAPAAKAFDRWGTRDALLVLVSSLAGGDLLKQERAKETLGILKDPAAVDPLADLAEKGNTTAVDALAAMGPVAEDGALRLLNCTDPTVQLAAVRALGEIGTSRSIAPLRALARSRPNNVARQDDIAALTKINDRLAAQAREEAKRRIKTVPTTNAENR